MYGVAIPLTAASLAYLATIDRQITYHKQMAAYFAGVKRNDRAAYHRNWVERLERQKAALQARKQAILPAAWSSVAFRPGGTSQPGQAIRKGARPVQPALQTTIAQNYQPASIPGAVNADFEPSAMSAGAESAPMMDAAAAAAPAPSWTDHLPMILGGAAILGGGYWLYKRSKRQG